MKGIVPKLFSWVLLCIASLLISGCAGTKAVILLPEEAVRVSSEFCTKPLAVRDGTLWCIALEEGAFLGNRWALRFYVVIVDLETRTVIDRVRIPDSQKSGRQAFIFGESEAWIGSRGDLFRFDIAARRIEAIPLPMRPLAFFAADGDIWAMKGNQLFQINLRTGELIPFSSLERDIRDVLVAHGSIWALQTPDRISRIDLQTRQVVSTVRAPATYEFPINYAGRGMMVYSSGALWVVLARPWTFRSGGGFPTAVGRLDPQSNEIVELVDFSAVNDVVYIMDIDAEEDAIVVATTNSILSIDPLTKVARHVISLPFAPNHISLHAGTVLLATENGVFGIGLK